MAERGPPGGEPARAIEEPLDLVAEVSGPDSGPEVKGEEGRGEACGGLDGLVGGLEGVGCLLGGCVYHDEVGRKECGARTVCMLSEINTGVGSVPLRRDVWWVSYGVAQGRPLGVMYERSHAGCRGSRGMCRWRKMHRLDSSMVARTLLQ